VNLKIILEALVPRYQVRCDIMDKGWAREYKAKNKKDHICEGKGHGRIGLLI
jgi:hypothetical protein